MPSIQLTKEEKLLLIKISKVYETKCSKSKNEQTKKMYAKIVNEFKADIERGEIDEDDELEDDYEREDLMTLDEGDHSEIHRDPKQVDRNPSKGLELSQSRTGSEHMPQKKMRVEQLTNQIPTKIPDSDHSDESGREDQDPDSEHGSTEPVEDQELEETVREDFETESDGESTPHDGPDGIVKRNRPPTEEQDYPPTEEQDNPVKQLPKVITRVRKSAQIPQKVIQKTIESEEENGDDDEVIQKSMESEEENGDGDEVIQKSMESEEENEDDDKNIDEFDRLSPQSNQISPSEVRRREEEEEEEEERHNTREPKRKYKRGPRTCSKCCELFIGHHSTIIVCEGTRLEAEFIQRNLITAKDLQEREKKTQKLKKRLVKEGKENRTFDD